MYNILSLDGGGIRGIILLEQLIVLEDILQCKIKDKFDLISGTSTGGIIAVMLALGYTAREIMHFYIEYSDKIFEKKWYRLGLLRPKYDDKFFEFIINQYVGNKTLKDIKNIDILIPGFDITTNDKIIFKSQKAKINQKYDYSLFDVIRSTSSAPTYFKPHLLSNNHYYVDGGLVINNPSMISWVEALNNTEIDTKINILSLSTGNKKTNLPKRIINGGKLLWAGPTVDILLAEQAKIVDYHMRNLFLREPGTYTRCKSVIEHSSGKIDDTSISNIHDMIIDGQISAELNYANMIYFCSKINI